MAKVSILPRLPGLPIVGRAPLGTGHLMAFAVPFRFLWHWKCLVKPGQLRSAG